MKTIQFVLPLLAASASVVLHVVHERRQIGNLASLLGYLVPGIPPRNASKIEDWKPSIAFPNIKRKRFTYGPFRLRANGTKFEGNSLSLDPQGTAHNYVVSDFPTNITMLLGVMSIVDEKGEEISNEKKIYNHHNYMMDVSKGFRANVQCPGGKRDLASVNALMGGAAGAYGNVTSLSARERKTAYGDLVSQPAILLQF